ncbi:MAG: DUF2975 domain-containing protein [bacterium]
MGILLIGFVAVVFVPKGLLNWDMANLEQISVRLVNILNEINGDILAGDANVKNLILMILFAGVVNLSFFQFVQIQLKKIVSSVRDEMPFRNANAIILRNLGLGYIIASVFVSFVNSWMFMTLVNTFNVFNATYNFSIDWQMVFMGIIILILAYIFSFGSYLQEEHDATV